MRILNAELQPLTMVQMLFISVHLDLAHVLQPATLWMISDSYAAMPINFRQGCMLLSIPSFMILSSMIRWI